MSETARQFQERFNIVKQSELSYALLLDDEFLDEYCEKESAEQNIVFWADRLEAAYLAGRRAEREACAQIAERYWSDAKLHFGDAAEAIRAHREEEQ